MSVELTRALDLRRISETLDHVVGEQSASGCVPWWSGGPCDPWDLVEAAMALDAWGRHEQARAAYAWLIGHQRADGAWPARWRDDQVVDKTLDSNLSSYVAVGLWHHFLCVGDDDFLAQIWPRLEAAIDFALDMQLRNGAIAWARDAHYRIWNEALVSGSSCVYLSLECALRAAHALGMERPEWELSLQILGEAVRRSPEGFMDKDRFAMDWYYPVLCGVVSGDAAVRRLLARWDEFVVEGRGARCVADRPWVTAAETCELVMAAVRVGLLDEALVLLDWVQHLRDGGGGYWTGATFPDGTIWPRERTTWSAAAVLLAAASLDPDGPTAACLGAGSGQSMRRSRRSDPSPPAGSKQPEPRVRRYAS